MRASEARPLDHPRDGCPEHCCLGEAGIHKFTSTEVVYGVTGTDVTG